MIKINARFLKRVLSFCLLFVIAEIYWQKKFLKTKISRYNTKSDVSTKTKLVQSNHYNEAKTTSQSNHHTEAKTTSHLSNLECKEVKPKMSYGVLPPNYPNKICENSQCMKNKPVDWNMVMFVKSNAYNFEQRDIIRQTWASFRYVHGGKFRTIFVIGTAKFPEQSLVVKESGKHEDILQIPQLEKPENITLKVLAGMQWASENLPHDYLYASIDADYLIDIGGVYKNINDYLDLSKNLRWPEFPLLCMTGVRFTEQPIRSPRHREYVSIKQYRWPYYPRYCSGGMYVTSVRIASQIYEESRTEEALRKEDAWITGLLRVKLRFSSEMVLNVSPVIGYSKREEYRYEKLSNETRNSLMEDWKMIFTNLKDNPHCRCSWV